MKRFSLIIIVIISMISLSLIGYAQTYHHSNNYQMMRVDNDSHHNDRDHHRGRRDGRHHHNDSDHKSHHNDQNHHNQGNHHNNHSGHCR